MRSLSGIFGQACIPSGLAWSALPAIEGGQSRVMRAAMSLRSSKGPIGGQDGTKGPEKSKGENKSHKNLHVHNYPIKKPFRALVSRSSPASPNQHGPRWLT